jgi:formylglycine-generating enzyme required for sulfatase activity
MKCAIRSIVPVLLLSVTASLGSESIAGHLRLTGVSRPAQGAKLFLFDLSDLSLQGIAETDSDGRFSLTVDQTAPSAPDYADAPALLRNYPNPFNPSTTIPYELQRAARVRLEIYNALGQNIATLIDAERPAGHHRAVWNGLDGRGQGVATGIYIYRLTVDGLASSQRMVMIDGRGPGGLPAETPAAGGDLSSNPPAPSPVRSFGLVVAGEGLETTVYPEIALDGHDHHLEIEVAGVAEGISRKPAAGGTSLVGDVNDDGVVNVVDALIIATFEINPDIVLPLGGHIAVGDVNGDGAVNIVDALMVATYGVDPGNPSLPAALGTLVETPNREPFFRPIGNRAISPGVQLIVELVAEDLDGDPLMYSMSRAIEGASVQGQTFRWTPDPDWVGSLQVTFAVEDGRGGRAEEAISLYTPELVAELPAGETMEFVWIEPGTFLMGSPPSEVGEDEQPQHEVTISRGFYMGKHEITQGEWQSVMGLAPWAGKDNVVEHPDHPAVHVLWREFVEFTRLLNELAGDNLYRLPTEAEWEYSTRAGTTTRWSFGDDDSQLGDFAWYSANTWDVGEGYAHRVGTKLPNLWGLHDMHGNVAEYVVDAFGRYGAGHQIDPKDDRASPFRTIRGGTFHHLSPAMRSASRGSLEAEVVRLPAIGSRLLRVR